MARDRWIILYILIVCNICKQYLVVMHYGGIRFGVIEGVNVKLYMPSVGQNQNVGDINIMTFVVTLQI